MGSFSFSLVLLPWLWPTPSPGLMPTPTTATTAWATTVLDTDSVTTDTVLVTTDTPVLATTDTVLDTVATTVAITARGPLTPSPLPPLMPRLIPTTDTTDKCPADSNHPKTSLGTTSSEKWIVQFGSFPTSATSFSATRLAQARNGEQEAKENQNVMIRRIKK